MISGMIDMFVDCLMMAIILVMFAFVAALYGGLT